VKAYSEILAEMPILEFGEKSYLASPSSSDYCDSPSVGNISVEDAIDYKKVNYLNEPSAESISIGMSQLDLSRKAPSKRLVQGSNLFNLHLYLHMRVVRYLDLVEMRL
jgi:hypothetical protein